MKKNKVLENTVMLYILIASNYVFNFITIPYQTRIMGPEIYGKIGFAFAFSIYFKLLFDFGFILSATEDVSENRDNLKKVSNILSEVFFSKILLIFIGFLIFIILIYFVGIFQNNKLLFFLYFLYVSIDCFQPDFIYRGLENMKVITIRNVIVKFIFMIMTFVFLKNSSQYLYVPLFNLLGSLVSLIWVYYDMFKNLKIKLVFVRFKNIVSCLKKSGIYFLSRIATTLYGATNTFILGFVYPTGSVLGYYSSADKILSAARSAMSPISDSIYPYMVRNKDFKLIKKILIIFMPIILIGSIIVFIFAKEICVIAFGKEFINSYVILRYMIPIIIITLPSYLIGFPTMSPLGLKREANFSVIVASIYHILIIIVLLLINRLNVYSLCILTITTEFLILIIRLFYIFKEMKYEKSFNLWNI